MGDRGGDQLRANCRCADIRCSHGRYADRPLLADPGGALRGGPLSVGAAAGPASGPRRRGARRHRGVRPAGGPRRAARRAARRRVPRPRRGAGRRRPSGRRHLLPQGVRAAHAAVPRPLPLLHVRHRAAPPARGVPRARRGAGDRPRRSRGRVQGGAVHPRRPAGGALAGGPRVAGGPRLPLHARVRARVRDRRAGGDGPAAAPQPGRHELGGAHAAQARRAQHGDDAGDHGHPAVVGEGRAALRQPGQGARRPAPDAHRRRAGGRPVHHRHPHRDRGDAGRAGRVAVRDPGRRPRARARPGDDRPELPGEAGHRDGARPGRRSRRPRRHDRRRPAGARPEDAAAGPAEPRRRRVRAHAPRRDRRLGRRLAGDGGPREPRAPLAGDRRAGGALGRGRVHAARAAHGLPALRPGGLAVDRHPAARARGGARRSRHRSRPGGRRPVGRPWQEPDGGFRLLGPRRPQRHDRHRRPHGRPPWRLRVGVRRLGLAARRAGRPAVTARRSGWGATSARGCASRRPIPRHCSTPRTRTRPWR